MSHTRCLIRLLTLVVACTPLLARPAGAAEADDGDAPARPAPKASLEVVVDAEQAAGVPVILELRLTNTGETPFSYWCGGPGRYPGAQGFVATVTDAAGQTSEVRLSNGQYIQGSGFYEEIVPGQTVTFPAVLDPLPPGEHSIRVKGGAGGYYATPDAEMTITWPATETAGAAEVRVEADPARADEFGRDLLARVRAREAFARHVTAKYSVDAVIDAVVNDLEAADDDKTVLAAAEALNALSELPTGLGRSILQAVERQLLRGEPDHKVLGTVVYLAGREGSDDALRAVLAVARDAPEGGTRSQAAQALAGFRQVEAIEALRGLLDDADAGVRRKAVSCLVYRRDPAVIPALAEMMSDARRDEREFALTALTRLPADEDGRLMKAIEAAIHDSDESISSAAKREYERRRPRETQQEGEGGQGGD